jgi:putative membrane protein
MRLRHAVTLFALAFSTNALADDPAGTTMYPTGDMPKADDGMKPADMPTKPMERLNDGQILGAMIALDDTEKKLASLVIGRTKNKDVEAFATRMRDEHEALNEELRGWGHQANVIPADSDTEDHMDQKRHDEHEKLEKLKGRELDRAYMDAMVAGHQKALMKIDRFTTDATDQALKTILMNARPKVEAHLAEAQRVQALLTGPSQTGPSQGGAYGKTNNVVEPIR